MIRIYFASKPWLKPVVLAWPGLYLALALASVFPSLSQTKPSPSHGFRAKPSQHNTNGPGRPNAVGEPNCDQGL
ncbi:hypothetical protein C8R47DRAFT_1147877 [Mycena vitilis]|nr:hypothetical protein C8R47DRAFT_1147877 [Mycena vitilis]